MSIRIPLVVPFVLAVSLACGEHVAWLATSFADPTLWKGRDGRYYALATPGGNPEGARYLTSEDALTWRRAATGPFDRETASAIKKDWKNVWAPEVRTD